MNSAPLWEPYSPLGNLGQEHLNDAELSQPELVPDELATAQEATASDAGPESTDDTDTSLDAAAANEQTVTDHEAPSAVEPRKKKWGLKLALGGAALTAALIAAPHAIEAKDAIVDNLAWAAPVLITSEAAWNTGAALMLIAAGKKIGNPLKLHSRFKEVSSEFGTVVEKPLFKAGMITNIAGELGTASILIGGSIAELPVGTWPLTIGTSVALAAPAAVAWTALWKAKHPNAN